MSLSEKGKLNTFLSSYGMTGLILTLFCPKKNRQGFFGVFADVDILNGFI